MLCCCCGAQQRLSLLLCALPLHPQTCCDACTIRTTYHALSDIHRFWPAGPPEMMHHKPGLHSVCMLTHAQSEPTCG